MCATGLLDWRGNVSLDSRFFVYRKNMRPEQKSRIIISISHPQTVWTYWRPGSGIRYVHITILLKNNFKTKKVRKYFTT